MVAYMKEEGSSTLAHQFDDDALWEMKLRDNEAMKAGSYPERPGEQDCSYYVRTGHCGFGVNCKYNHPINRKLAVTTGRMRGEYPQRKGQPECQYYLKTGTCKFGATCKFHHPKDKAGIAGRTQLNSLGYPLRPNETECSYYLRTGQCKFGNTCKFHHPQPSNAMVSFPGSIYPNAYSPTTPGQQSYSGETNWPISRASYLPSPRWQGSSSYTQVILPQGVMQVPSWNAYSGQLGSSSPENQQQMPENGQVYGGSRQSETTNTGAQGAFSPYPVSSVPMEMYTLQRETIFPERPGEPECVFYMKTGDCKYGPVCRFHHPRERLFPAPDCALSPLGLPLRPGEPLCIYYSRYGICKFGPNCKFDHPMETLMSGISASTADVPVHHMLGSQSGAAALSLSSEDNMEGGDRNSMQISKRDLAQIASGVDKVDADGPRTPTSRTAPANSFP